MASLASGTALAQQSSSVTLLDLDSGSPDPQGHYRWMDAADQLYAASYRETYDYTQASVRVDFLTGADTLRGTLTADRLKPNFAYQFKLVGNPGTDSNERIGLTGRWWQEEWDGAEWANGQNLNDKGDGSSPNPNDQTYFARRDLPDTTSPTGRHYRYLGYWVFDYFVTDAWGRATHTFEAKSSYHVLWKTSQRTRTAQDGRLEVTTFDVGLPDPVMAYDVDYPEQTVGIFGEWERLPVGGVILPAGLYEGQFVLTEESFHGTGLAGVWAGAMGANVTFRIGSPGPGVPGVGLDGWIAMSTLLLAAGAYALWRGLPFGLAPRRPLSGSSGR